MEIGDCRLYLVTGPAEPARLRAAVAGGADIVQLRMKDAADDDAVLAEARTVRDAIGAGALFIVNDRPDLVAAAGADGVHVGQDDMPVAQARDVLGDRRLIGLSTHTPEQIDAAQGSGADYIGVGPVHSTPTKPGRPAVGLELVRYAAEHSALPWFAIGGIDAGNVAAVAAAGATRIAVVRAIGDAADPEMAAAQLRYAIDPQRALGRA